MSPCKTVPYLVARCAKPVASRRWKLFRTRDDVPTLPGRVCFDCATRVANSTDGDYTIHAAGERA